MAFPVGWTRRCPLVIQHGQVPANQTAFPVLITNASGCLPAEMVTLSGPNAAQSDGGDIRFSSDLAGTSQLACEIVVWTQNATSSAAVAEIWVPVSVLTASDVTIYVWYNAGGGLSQPAANASFGSQAVWDANYCAVYHCQDGTTIAGTDSTSKGNNFDHYNGSPTASAGKIDGAITVSGSNSIIIKTLAVSYPGGASAQTCECWINPSSLSAGYGFAVAYGDVSAAFKGVFIGKHGSDGIIGIQSNFFTVTSAWATSTWYHVVFTYDGIQGRAYINGSLTAGPTTQTANITNNLSNHSWIGDDGFAEYFAGTVDEYRVSTTNRSTNWITTQYNNQNSPGSFILAGTAGPVSGSSSLFRVTSLSGLGAGGPFFTNPLG